MTVITNFGNNRLPTTHGALKHLSNRKAHCPSSLRSGANQLATGSIVAVLYLSHFQIELITAAAPRAMNARMTGG
jgi:hypothetical protein